MNQFKKKHWGQTFKSNQLCIFFDNVSKLHKKQTNNKTTIKT